MSKSLFKKSNPLNWFKHKKDGPAPETPVAPTPDDEAARIAEERRYQRRFGRRGRTGTVLSEGGQLG